MSQQAKSCAENCWEKFNKITKKPADLKKCFTRTGTLFEDFVVCFQNNIDACLTRPSNITIPKLNITKFVDLAVNKMHQTKLNLTKSLPDSIITIVDTTETFALCVKDCFVAKNKDGFCFDKKKFGFNIYYCLHCLSCQPLVLDKKVKKTFKTCTKVINWKKETSDLCECSVNAGLRSVFVFWILESFSDLKNYCSMIKLMGNNRRSNKTMTHHPKH